MRISELSAQTGVAVPTIKYYLRERLLPEGERSAPTQAAYGEKHVERLRVIRALIGSGVSIAETRRVLAALDHPPENMHDLLGTAHNALAPSDGDELDVTEARELVAGMGFRPGMCSDEVLQGVARALRGLEDAGFVVPHENMPVYLKTMREIADAELARVPTESAEAAVRYVVLGSVMVEPLLLALRRVAQQVASAEQYGAGAEE